jgi:hypothetical protein
MSKELVIMVENQKSIFIFLTLFFNEYKSDSILIKSFLYVLMYTGLLSIPIIKNLQDLWEQVMPSPYLKQLMS